MDKGKGKIIDFCPSKVIAKPIEKRKLTLVEFINEFHDFETECISSMAEIQTLKNEFAVFKNREMAAIGRTHFLTRGLANTTARTHIIEGSLAQVIQVQLDFVTNYAGPSDKMEPNLAMTNMISATPDAALEAQIQAEFDAFQA